MAGTCVHAAGFLFFSLQCFQLVRLTLNKLVLGPYWHVLTRQTASLVASHGPSGSGDDSTNKDHRYRSATLEERHTNPDHSKGPWMRLGDGYLHDHGFSTSCASDTLLHPFNYTISAEPHPMSSMVSEKACDSAKAIPELGSFTAGGIGQRWQIFFLEGGLRIALSPAWCLRRGKHGRRFYLIWADFVNYLLRHDFVGRSSIFCVPPPPDAVSAS